MATDMFGPMSGMGDLSAVEKLRIVTALWDDIARSAEPIVVPDDILDESSRRSEQIADDPSMAIGDAELWRRVDG
jgi:putative addiction module component (TIGR02574 family)